MTRPLLFVLPVLLCGCHNTRDSELVGSWKASQGRTLEGASDGGFRETSGKLLIVRGL